MKSNGKNKFRESDNAFEFSDKNYESNDPSESQNRLQDYCENNENNTKKYYHDLNDGDVGKMDLPDFPSENEMTSDIEDEDQSEEPVINKTLVMLQKELHKSLFSPSLMKINESPKFSLLTDRSKNASKNLNGSTNHDPNSNDNTSPSATMVVNHDGRGHIPQSCIPNIFGMNVRPSSGEVVSPTSESSAHSVRKEHLSKDNRYQLHDGEIDDNASDLMSLESIVIKKEDNAQMRQSQNDSVEEAFTPNFITKRSSMGNNLNEVENMYYKDGRNMIPYDYRPPLVQGIESDSNQYINEGEFSESFDVSDQNYSSNREDLEECKVDLTFPPTSSKNN
jgi:hypothetical protein